MSNQSVLVVEDDDHIRELLVFILRNEGYEVAAVSSGEQALARAETSPPDLILLDLMLPGVDGLTVCRRLRSNARTKDTAIVILSAKGEEADIVVGLNLGANDYITKPFNRNVLLARIRAVFRGASPSPETGTDEERQVIRAGALVIHPGRFEVLVDGEPVDLSATEFRVLHTLAKRAGWVFTREQILDAVHGDRYAITPRAVDVQIVGLRRKLGAAGRLVETVRGIGYRFRD